MKILSYVCMYWCIPGPPNYLTELPLCPSLSDKFNYFGCFAGPGMHIYICIYTHTYMYAYMYTQICLWLKDALIGSRNANNNCNKSNHSNNNNNCSNDNIHKSNGSNNDNHTAYICGITK